MIIRNNKIRPSSAEVKIGVSYSLPDVKAFLKRFITQMYAPLTSEASLQFLLQDTITERELRQTMEKAEWCFGNYENPLRSQLSAWLWYQIVSNDFVTPSGTSTTVYFFSEKALNLVKVSRKKN